jgi:peptide-methionine (R)-S-oxide reductase
MTTHTTTRRAFFASTAAAAVAPIVPAAAASSGSLNKGDFDYEIQRTEAEWRAMLTEDEYRILRESKTEQRFTGEMWQEEGEGSYHCRGCDLKIYESTWKRFLPIGWVFFYHSEPTTVMTAIDEWPNQMSNTEGMTSSKFVIEAHCRRCASHLGHILLVQGEVNHCINATALTFRPQAA